nr:hypothetical protein CFP56_04035 [Quercus suber]
MLDGVCYPVILPYTVPAMCLSVEHRKSEPHPPSSVARAAACTAERRMPQRSVRGVHGLQRSMNIGSLVVDSCPPAMLLHRGSSMYRRCSAECLSKSEPHCGCLEAAEYRTSIYLVLKSRRPLGDPESIYNRFFDRLHIISRDPTMTLSRPSGGINSTISPQEIPPYTECKEDAQIPQSINHACSHEKQSQTPHLDAHMQRPEVQARMLVVSQALSDVVSGKSCTKCASKTVAEQLYAHLHDVKAANKCGQWSREEKKAMKKEAKVLIKDLRKEMKGVWKTKH